MLGQSHFLRGLRRPIHLHAIPRKRTRQPQLLAVSEKDPRRDTEQDRHTRQDGARLVRAEISVHRLCQERHEARDDSPDEGKAGECGGAVEKIRVG